MYILPNNSMMPFPHYAKQCVKNVSNSRTYLPSLFRRHGNPEWVFYPLLYGKVGETWRRRLSERACKFLYFFHFVLCHLCLRVHCLFLSPLSSFLLYFSPSLFPFSPSLSLTTPFTSIFAQSNSQDKLPHFPASLTPSQQLRNDHLILQVLSLRESGVG